MPTFRKCLSQTVPPATTLTDSYTVPVGTETVVSAIWVCNTNPSTDAVFSISVAIGGAADSTKQYILSLIPIDAGDTWEATVGVTLSAGDVIRVYSSQSNMAFQFYGAEIVGSP